MDDVTLIRIIAGILAVVVLGIIIWRRRRQASED
jgi:LPXTG-motif cell wall-anchored protein